MTACNTLCLETIREVLVLLSAASIDQTGSIKQRVKAGLCRRVCVLTALESWLNRYYF